MASQLQTKILNDVRGLIEGYGYQVLDHPQYPNTGSLHVQDPKKVGDLALVTYNFQADRYTLTFTYAGKRIPSQPGRADYFDWYLAYDDAAGHERFRNTVRQHLRPAGRKAA